MPWSASDAKKKYPKLKKHEAEVWAKVANSSLEAGDDDATAIKKANAAVKKLGRHEAIVLSVAGLEEAGRMISAANMKTLRNAMSSMKAAIESIMPLMADDAEEALTFGILTQSESDAQRWELVKLDEAAKILAQNDSYDQIRYAVSSALRKRAISDRIATKVADGSSLGYDDYYDYGCMPYIRDLYDGYVVYSMDGELYQCEYSVTDDTVSLGDPTEVKVSYVPVSSSTTSESKIEIKGDIVELIEKAVKDDGTARVKLISPGWGSSGYYSTELLKRDGPKAFAKGTHMYMNHPTEEEDRVRPERDVRDLAGVIESDVLWEDESKNNTGPGLYANVKVFPAYKEFIDAAAQHIGVSIRASGTAIEGQAEDRHGLLVNSLDQGYSVDYVTMAGRGGEILPLYESARKRIVVQEVTEIEERSNVVDISQEEFDRLKEAAERTNQLATTLTEATTNLAAANTTIARMQEAMLLSEARGIVAQTLSTIENLSNITRERLTAQCLKDVPVKEGVLDKDALVEAVKAAAVAEIQYLEGYIGSVTGGKVTGITAPKTDVSEADVDKALTEAWSVFGISGDSTKIATLGRN